jgi:hypothetical protein
VDGVLRRGEEMVNNVLGNYVVCSVKGVKVKVKCTLVQALRLCTDRTAQSGSRVISLLFHNHGNRRG